MCIKRVKRKCSVRGCKNTECFAISRNREVGNTVIICKDCLIDALDDIDKMPSDARTNIPKQSDIQAPPLFFNSPASPRQVENKTKITKSKKNEGC